MINRPERTSQAIKPSDTLHSSGSWHHLEFYALQFVVDTHTHYLLAKSFAMTFLAYHLQEKVGSTRFCQGTNMIRNSLLRLDSHCSSNHGQLMCLQCPRTRSSNSSTSLCLALGWRSPTFSFPRATASLEDGHSYIIRLLDTYMILARVWTLDIAGPSGHATKALLRLVLSGCHFISSMPGPLRSARPDFW